ncbi:3-hydroxyacyl-CoA dehydrogenase @ 17hydroxysteroid dehydrogenase type 10 (HSD10)-like [hydrothermal vent metagenome]|uniref:3-hydroxyacyl-CoA dehydrogenase @ 17hydroxysteroid dehydrogenase type 10 (HSD10)-like n=1 Tax=hydrothermal vent metagenome TaxID=652676 RepID=A0A3B0UAN8_9ZZZZ
MQLDNSIAAIVSGGASGLGAASAKALAAKGVKVTIFDLNHEAGSALAKEIGGVFAPVDVADPESVAAGIELGKKQHGVARIIVNCAGIAPAAKTVSRGLAHDPASFAKTIGINLIGSFNTSSQAAAQMAATEPLASGERGVIINTASVAAYDGQIGQIAYAASKGGIVGMTLPMARDLASHAIRVMGIAPGIFKTPMVEAFPEEVQNALAAQIPFPARLGNPAEYGALAIHICQNEMLNGEVIRLDGAIRMPPR